MTDVGTTARNPILISDSYCEECLEEGLGWSVGSACRSFPGHLGRGCHDKPSLRARLWIPFQCKRSHPLSPQGYHPGYQ
jgi:hypothetical protein